MNPEPKHASKVFTEQGKKEKLQKVAGVKRPANLTQLDRFCQEEWAKFEEGQNPESLKPNLWNIQRIYEIISEGLKIPLWI